MKPMLNGRAGILVPLASLVASTGLAPTASAAAVQNTLNSGSWSDGAIWSGGVAPKAADAVTLVDAGSGGALPVSLAVNSGMTADTLTVAAASKLTHSGGGFGTLFLSGQAGSGSIQAPLTLDAVALGWFNQGMANSFTIASDVTLDHGASLTGGGGPGAGGLRFSGTTTIASSTGNGQVFTGVAEKTGGGTTTFADSVKVTLGTFRLKDGTLELNGTGANATVLQGQLTFAPIGFNPATLVNKGTLTVGNGGNQTIWNETGNWAEIQNQGLLEKTAAGHTYFSGAPFRNTGTLRISGGWVHFESSSQFLQQGAGSLLDLAAGDLWFGNLVGVIGGALALTGQRTIDAPPGVVFRAELRIDIAGAGAGQADRLNVLGPLTLDPVNDPGATLVVNNTGGAFAEGTTFTILSASSLSGAFKDLPDGTDKDWGDGQLFRIKYSATDVTLTAVPEPELGAVLTALGLAGFAWRRRHHGTS